MCVGVYVFVWDVCPCGGVYVCVLGCMYCMYERVKKPGARKETRSAKGTQEREKTRSAKAREREGKSAKFKAQKRAQKRQRERVPPGARKRKREDQKKARAQLCVLVH